MSGLTDLTGGLIDTNTPNYAQVAGKSEKKRQGIIKLGLDQINSVFSGGTSPFFSAANTGTNKFDPQGTYYGLNKQGSFAPYWAPGGAHPKSQFTQSTGGKIGGFTAGIVSGVPFSEQLGMNLFGNLFGKTTSPREIAAKQFKRGQLFSAPQYRTLEGFQEPFYQKRAQDYVNFALPQLGQQYRTNRNAMLFGLANRGLTGSTVQDQASANLEREAGIGRQTIADTGLEQSNQLRKDVESGRQQAISQLYQSADPAQALQGAVRTASQIQSPSTFAPISNLFTNLAQQYATKQLLDSYRQPYGAPNNYQGVGGGQQNGSYLSPIP